MLRSVLAFAVLLPLVAVGCFGSSETVDVTADTSQTDPRLVPSNDEEPPAQSEPEQPAWTHVVSSEAVYYKASPAQGTPPDGKLAAGVKAQVLEEAGSYTLIETEEGVQGFVASDALQALADVE